MITRAVITLAEDYIDDTTRNELYRRYIYWITRTIPEDMTMWRIAMIDLHLLPAVDLFEMFSWAIRIGFEPPAQLLGLINNIC